ncbi:MAG: AAA family ATPase [Thermoproteota archaeon]
MLICGELGSGTTDVGNKLSKITGIPVYNTEYFFRTIVNEIKVSFEQLAEMEKSGEIDLEGVVRNMVIDKLSEGNAIIEGRSALLGLDKPANLKVFLHKDKEDRIKLVAERRKISLEEAAKEVEFSDKERSERARVLFNVDWTNSKLYDITINTSKLSHDEAAEIIANVLAIKNKKK